eukprot:TRINITY_DN14780_c0_g2_i1.p1 TRINITY_DN14780_c0_g2~~TRINITY_DN14780_c0_g2_i1.p1  ORF type:complete len:201 (-),score=58.27 TRINITY_DN14780_c0_g2_i1:126-728(-)
MSFPSLCRILPTTRVVLRPFSPLNASPLACLNLNKRSTRLFASQPQEDENPLLKLEIPEHVNKLADQILGLPAMDAGLLFEAIRRKAGLPADFEKSMSFSAGPGGPAPAAAAQEAAAAAPAAEEKPAEKTSFTVKLISFDEASKFKVLKEIRALKPGMQLMESKALIEKLPSILKEDVSKDEGGQWVEKLKAAGAVVELA